MDFAAGPLFSVIVVLLLTAPLVLRAKFPNASTRTETVAVVITAVLFFGLCYLFLPRASVGGCLPPTSLTTCTSPDIR
jgi:hypothetical protein